jgi:hypothetical protein
LIIKFQGAEAEGHRIEAKKGLEALAGFSAATARIAHYVAEGKVRYRQPFSDSVELYLERTEPGSLNFIFGTVVKGARKVGEARQTTDRLIRRVIRRATGQAKEGSLTVGDREIPAGDIDALAEAIEPSLRRAHAWTNTRGKSMTVTGDDAKPFVLSKATKDYLDSEIEDDHESVQDVSVGALNVNGRTGGVYFHDLGRTVPFYVPRNAAARTITVLSRYLTQYAEKTGATVNISFRRIRYPDERLKRIIIHDCYAIGDLA